MWRIVIAMSVGLTVGVATPSQAQRPANRGDDEVKKLQQQIEKIQAEIKAAEARMKAAEEPKPGDAGRRPDQPADSGGPGRGRRGPGGGFGGGPGGGFGGGFGAGELGGPGFGRGGMGGFGPGTGGGFGPGFAGGMGSFEFGNDVKSLESQLERLKAASKTIDRRIKEVEVRLKKAKDDEAKKEAAGREERRKAIAEKARQAAAPGSSERKPDLEKRLDRIESVLEEIQKELRRRRPERN